MVTIQGTLLNDVRTNYVIFSIRLQGPMIWNSIDEDFKYFSLSSFKSNLKEHMKTRLIIAVMYTTKSVVKLKPEKIQG